MQGVSTRSVDDLVQAMGVTGISKKPGQPAVRRDLRQGAGLPRPSDRGKLAVSVDRRHLREVRPNGRIVSVAVIVAVGVNSRGRREVVGMDIGPSQAETAMNGRSSVPAI
nr:transposase and inactivated derivatives [Bradyrhizobium sp. DOA9]